MAAMNHGQSPVSATQWLAGYLGLTHTRDIVTRAKELDPYERRMVERISRVAAGTGKFQVDVDASGKPIIRFAGKTGELTREGLKEAYEFLGDSGISSYFEYSSSTPKAMRFNYSGERFVGMDENIFAPLEKHFAGKEVRISREGIDVGSTSMKNIMNRLSVDGDITGMVNFTENSGLSVIRAQVDGRYLTEQEMMRIVGEGPHGLLSFKHLTDDPRNTDPTKFNYSKLAKRAKTGIYNQSAYAVPLQGRLSVGVLDAQSFMDIVANKRARFPTGRGTAVNDILRTDDFLRKTAVDGAVILNGELLDRVVSEVYTPRIKDLEAELRMAKSNNSSSGVIGAIEAQIRREKNIINNTSRAAKGGRLQNFRAMGIKLEDLGAVGAFDKLTPERRTALERAMIKGDAMVLPREVTRNGKKVNAFQEYVRHLSRLQQDAGFAAIDTSLENADILAFANLGGRGVVSSLDPSLTRGPIADSLAFTLELGYREGADQALLEFMPTEVKSRVRTNVRTITGFPGLFDVAKQGADGNLIKGFEGVAVDAYTSIIREVERTGTIPPGYLRDLIYTLNSEEAHAVTDADKMRIHNLKARASDLLDSTLRNNTIKDPAVVREFMGTMRDSITRAGKHAADPLLEIPSSLYAHVAPDIFSLPAKLPGEHIPERVTGMMSDIAEGYLGYSKEYGLSMDGVTAAKHAAALGGYDWDDALELHMRWSRNAAGGTELFGVVARNPLSAGEGAVFKILGFDDAMEGPGQLASTIEMLETAFKNRPEAEEIAGIREMLRSEYPSDNILANNYDTIDEEVFTAADSRTKNALMEFIERNVLTQLDVNGEQVTNGYEYMRRKADRRLGTQIEFLADTDPIKKLYNAESIEDKVKLLGVLAERGMVTELGDDRVYNAAGELDEDVLRRIAVDDSLMRQIKEDRVLRYETMSSYESWLKMQHGRRASSGRSSVLDVLESKELNLGVQRGWIKDEFDELISAVAEVDDLAERKSIARKMLEQAQATQASPGILGRSVNVSMNIDELSIKLNDMIEAKYLTEVDIQDFMRVAPYMETETIIDAIVQGVNDPKLRERILRTYHAQVAATADMMLNLEEAMKKAAENSGESIESITRRFGMSKDLLRTRLTRDVFAGGGQKDAADIFRAALIDRGRLPVDAAMESADDVEALLSRMNIFGEGVYGSIQQASRSVLSMFENETDTMLRNAYSTMPDLVGQVFTEEEVSKAKYLQDIYTRSVEVHKDLLDRPDNPIFALRDMLNRGTTVDDLAHYAAQDSVIAAFTDNIAEFEDVTVNGETVRRLNEDSWRVLGAFIENSRNSRMIASAQFSVLRGGVRSFFMNKRLQEYGGIDPLDYYMDEFNNATLRQRETIVDAAGQEYPEIRAKLDEDLAAGLIGTEEERDAKLVRAMHERLVEENERLLNITPGDLEERSFREGFKIPDYARYVEDETGALRDIGSTTHQSNFKKIDMDYVAQQLSKPVVRKGIAVTAGIIAASFLYQGSQKREEDMLGEDLPGGGTLRSPIAWTQMDIANQYVPQSSSGVTYNVNVRGGNPGIRQQIEAIAGMESSGSVYNSLPRPGGDRAQFRDIEAMF